MAAASASDAPPNLWTSSGCPERAIGPEDYTIPGLPAYPAASLSCGYVDAAEAVTVALQDPAFRGHTGPGGGRNDAGGRHRAQPDHVGAQPDAVRRDRAAQRLLRRRHAGDRAVDAGGICARPPVRPGGPDAVPG